jgi:thiol-disulfide isomerase/thioredoxin
VKYLIFCVLLLSLVACNQSDDTAQPPHLEDLRGHWVVINYWAQWCKPCIEEIPELNALDKTYADVTVLGINYDGATGAELEQQRQELGVEFASLEADPSEALGVTRPVVLPTTFIVNPAGKLEATLIGPQTRETLAQATGQATNRGTE